MNASVIKLALLILGAAFLLCLGGIIWLSSSEHPIPDVLTTTTGLIGGGIVGILVPSKLT